MRDSHCLCGKLIRCAWRARGYPVRRLRDSRRRCAAFTGSAGRRRVSAVGSARLGWPVRPFAQLSVADLSCSSTGPACARPPGHLARCCRISSDYRAQGIRCARWPLLVREAHRLCVRGRVCAGSVWLARFGLECFRVGCSSRGSDRSSAGPDYLPLVGSARSSGRLPRRAWSSVLLPRLACWSSLPPHPAWPSGLLPRLVCWSGLLPRLAWSSVLLARLVCWSGLLPRLAWSSVLLARLACWSSLLPRLAWSSGLLPRLACASGLLPRRASSPGLLPRSATLPPNRPPSPLPTLPIPGAAEHPPLQAVSRSSGAKPKRGNSFSVSRKKLSPAIESPSSSSTVMDHGTQTPGSVSLGL